MAIDFSFLDAAAPQPQQHPQDGVANVTMRVDADALLLCDGEHIDIELKAGVIKKTKLPVGQHLLEFLSEENPDAKVEKVVDFPVAGKSYLVMVSGLKEALAKFEAKAAVALGAKRVFRLVINGYDDEISAMMVVRNILGCSVAEARAKLAKLPAVVIETEEKARVEGLARLFAKGNVEVAVETRNGLGELVGSDSYDTQKEVDAKRKAAEEAKRKAEAEAKRKAEAEAKRKAEEEAKRKAAEAAAKKEAARLAKMSTYELKKLGEDYYQGDNGKQKNYAEAVKYYRASADRGDTYAQYVIGHCYYFAQGIEKDYKEAVKWYRMAAEKGNGAAMKGLGNCYYYGKGVEEDEEEGVKWYTKAAEQGNAKAQYSLGRCYYYGRGVEKDKKEALKWYRKAADQGHSDAKKCLETDF